MRWTRDEARDGTRAENASLLNDDLEDLDPLAASPRNSAHLGSGKGRSFRPSWAGGGRGPLLTHGHSHGNASCSGHHGEPLSDFASDGASRASDGPSSAQVTCCGGYCCCKRCQCCGNERRLQAVMALNIGYTCAEFYCYYWFGSLTMLADGFHNLSDVLAVAIALKCERLKNQSDTASVVVGTALGAHLTFGAKRFEVVGGFVNAVLLLSLSLYVALDAIPRLFRPPVLDGSDEWVAIAAIGTGVHVGHAHSHGDESGGGGHAHAHGNNLNMVAVLLHALGDVFTAIAVTATAILIKIKGRSHTSGSCRDGYVVVEPGWDGGHTVVDETAQATLQKGTQVACHWFDFVDPAVSLVLAVGIGLSVLPLVRRALPILLDAAPPGVDVPRIRAQLLRIPRVVGVGALHVWMVDDGDVAACVAHLFVELPLPPLANSLDFGGASPASRPVSPSALSGTVAGAGDSRGFRGGKNRTGVPSAVPAELQMEGVFEAVRQRACDILSDSGVQHCTIQSVPLLPIEALSVDQAELREAYIKQAGTVQSHWTSQWDGSKNVPSSLSSSIGGMRASVLLDDSVLDRSGGEL